MFDKTYGDSNSDGTVNVMDATYIQRFSVGSVSADEINNQLADCDDNNTVNVMDATYIQRFTASLSGCANAGKIIEYIADLDISFFVEDEPNDQSQNNDNM